MTFFYIIYLIIAIWTFSYLYKIQKKNVRELNEEYSKQGTEFHMYYGSLFLESFLWPIYWLRIIYGAFFRK